MKDDTRMRCIECGKAYSMWPCPNCMGDGGTRWHGGPTRKLLDEARLRAMWGDPEFSTREIAADLGVSQSTVSRRAAELGLGDRPDCRHRARIEGEADMERQVIAHMAAALRAGDGDAEWAVAPVERVPQRSFDEAIKDAPMRDTPPEDEDPQGHNAAVTLGLILAGALIVGVSSILLLI